ncbi:HNH endonuclease [Lysinibacillus capsici]|uniref:HNH endonuclease n=1 Tax=Lysinibacillus capsici TaxID=2115968 RepID=UPI0032DF67DB
MIKINKVPCPIELTEKVKLDLTEEFKKSDKSVWQVDYIKNALLDSSHNKCAYCECLLNRESNYMEVEHFHHKKKYPDEVVEWDNLLPSCRRCNGKKHAYDTKLNPFVNPAIMDPKEHIILDNNRLRPITLEGENTIEELNLNDSTKVVSVRHELTEATNKSLEFIFQDVLDYIQNPNTRRMNRIISSLEELLKEGEAKSAYAGIVSASIINSPTFKAIRKLLLSKIKWDSFLEDKYIEISENALTSDEYLFHSYIMTKT